MTGKVFERSPETQSIVNALVALEAGEIIAYEALAAAAHTVDSGHFRGRVRTARAIALREHGVLCESVRKIGIRRMQEAEVGTSVRGDMNRMRRAAQRGREKISKGISDFEALPRDVQQQLMAQNASLGAIVLVTDQKSQRRLREYVEVSNQELNFGRTLELLKD